MSTKVKAQKSNQIDMCEGALFPKFIRFALPVMFSNILQQLFNTADMMVIGAFCGDISLAAISSTSSICALLTGLLLGISIGANVLAARHFGAKNDEALSRTVHTSLVLSLFAGILITTLGLILTPILLKSTNVPDNILPLSKLYLFIYFGGIIPSVIFTYAAALLRAVGDTKRPLYYLTFAGALNLVLNVLFVIVFKLDVAGVAIATVISQSAAAFLILRALLREDGAMKLEWRKLSFDRGLGAQILRVGFPAGLQTAMFAISNLAIQSSINSFGDMAMSGSGAAETLENFCYMAMNAWTVAVVSSTSQNFGKRNYKRILRSQLLGHACVIFMGLLLALIISVFGESLLGIYVDSPEAIRAGLIRFDYIAKLYFIYGIIDILTASLRGLDCSFPPMLIALFSTVGLRLLFINTVLKIPRFNTLEVLFSVYPITWAITALALLAVFVVLYRRTRRRFPDEI